MSSIALDHNKRALIQLRQRLEIYSETLVQWQQALDEADCEIEGLAASETLAAAAEIDGIQQSRIEFDALKTQVDAGWALYRRLSKNPKIASISINAFAPMPLPTSLQ